MSMIFICSLILLSCLARAEIQISVNRHPMTFDDDATVNDVRKKIKDMGMNHDRPFFLLHYRTGTSLANKDEKLMDVCNYLGIYAGDDLGLQFLDVRDLKRRYDADQIEEIAEYAEKIPADSWKKIYFLVRTISDEAEEGYEYNYVSRNAGDVFRLYEGKVPSHVQSKYQFIGLFELRLCKPYECPVCMEVVSTCAHKPTFRRNTGFECRHVGQVCIDCWNHMYYQHGRDKVKCPLCRMSKEQMAIDRGGR